MARVSGVDLCVYLWACLAAALDMVQQDGGFTDYNLQSQEKIYQETGMDEDMYSHSLYLWLDHKSCSTSRFQS